MLRVFIGTPDPLYDTSVCLFLILWHTSCYNAFARLDMRVHVTIPGTVESYCVDENGKKKPATDELWLETYLCSVLRAYSYADDGSGETIRKIMGVRRFNPVTNTETEHRFLSAAEQLFFRGQYFHWPSSCPTH